MIKLVLDEDEFREGAIKCVDQSTSYPAITNKVDQIVREQFKESDSIINYSLAPIFHSNHPFW